MLGNTFEKLLPPRFRAKRQRSLDQLRRRNADLVEMLRERDLLLQEVHHRVKNNLQIVASLINMQARKLNGEPREALLDCKTRVEAIALLHEKLYRSEDFALPFAAYLRSIADNLLHAADAAASGISLRMETQDIPLGVAKAVPCGLILNELLTNAMKHAFPAGAGGEIQVTLQYAGSRVQLTVSDNGVGMQEPDAAAANGSIGLQLVGTLTEQLDGTMQILISDGTSVRVDFPADA